MSIEVKIAPTLPPPLWGQVLDSLEGADVSLVSYGEQRSLRESEPLDIDVLYVVRAEGTTALSLLLFSNESTGLSPSSWIEDFGSNLTNSARVAAAWDRAGYYVLLESGVARGPTELETMARVAAAVAEAVSGYVVLSDSFGYSLGPGAYTPAEFRAGPPPPPPS